MGAQASRLRVPQTEHLRAFESLHGGLRRCCFVPDRTKTRAGTPALPCLVRSHVQFPLRRNNLRVHRMKNELINQEELLRKVSRSFYLTLRILPRSIRPQLGLAYLLARATDTIADTDAVAVDKRRHVLDGFRQSIQAVCAGRTASVPDFSSFMRTRQPGLSQTDDAEQTLLENFGILLNSLSRFEAADREKIRAVLEIITQGQQDDLLRFGVAGTSPGALTTNEELDSYTYAVAGCVGEFWTRLCRTHVFPDATLDENLLFADAVRFGKGLQLVNILRDLPKDLRMGRCYIPEQALSRHGLTPDDLLDAGVMNRFRPLYDEYLNQAEEHLRAGWRYTTTLPFGCFRVRLACAWPVLIGVQTLRRLRQANVLDADRRVKVSRAGIRRIIAASVFLYPRRAAWNRIFDRMT